MSGGPFKPHVLQHPHDQKSGAALTLLLFLFLLSETAWRGDGWVADSTSFFRSPLFHVMVSARLIERIVDSEIELLQQRGLCVDE